jgi:hypothetical protein
VLNIVTLTLKFVKTYEIVCAVFWASETSEKLQEMKLAQGKHGMSRQVFIGNKGYTAHPLPAQLQKQARIRQGCAWFLQTTLSPNGDRVVCTIALSFLMLTSIFTQH